MLTTLLKFRIKPYLKDISESHIAKVVVCQKLTDKRSKIGAKVCLNKNFHFDYVIMLKCLLLNTDLTYNFRK